MVTLSEKGQSSINAAKQRELTRPMSESTITVMRETPKPRTDWKGKYQNMRDVMLKVQFSIESLRHMSYFKKRWGKWQDLLDAIGEVL